MGSKLKEMFGSFFSSEKSDKLKLLFLSATFFLIIGAYTIIRDIKNSVFIGLVGKEYIPWARIVVLIFLVPAILLYSKVVDNVRRYYLLCIYSLVYAVCCLIFAFFIGHPTIGIGNTDQSAYRLFGWIFYFFVESFRPFVLSIFWAFSNSINSPESAKNNYGIMVSSSNLGGMLTAGIAWALFSVSSVPLFGAVGGIAKHQIILVLASVFLFLVPAVILFLMKKVPGYRLHGYEAAYEVEKERGKEGKAKTGIFAGLTMLMKYPYVFGIFCMVFFYEILVTVLSYLRLGVAQAATKSIAGTSGFLFKWVFIMQTIGLLVSFIGTNSLLRRLGTRICVLLIPIMIGIVVLFFVVGTTPFIVMTSFTVIKSINYAFSSPVIESLYIPTLKEIKFKSKSWIDAFGSKLAKGSGSGFNILVGYANPALFMPIYSFIFAIIIGMWFVAAFLLGMRFDKAVAKGEVIGFSGDEKE